MPEGSVVFSKIAGMLCVMLAGWWATRRGYLTGPVNRAVGLFVVDACLPALCFTSMVRTIDRGTLGREAWVPLFAVGALSLALAIGWVSAPLFVDRPRRRTFAFLVALPNWIYIPLPIAESLYGDAGVRFVLLFNAGAMVFVWTVAVAVLGRRGIGWESLAHVLLNPGILGLGAGIAVALLWPAARDIEAGAPGALAPQRLPAAAGFEALRLLGTLAVPLSLLITGSQFHAAPKRPGWAALGAAFTRLAIAPLATAGLLALAGRTGFRIGEPARMMSFIVLAMPVAVSCSLFIEKYDGDRELGSSSVLYSTLFSLATVPLLVWLCR